MSNKIYVPYLDQEVDRPWFWPNQESINEQKRILESLFFLIPQKNGSFGERLQCTLCQNRHDYITLMCVPRPFAGITGGLFAYWQMVKDNNLLRHMDAGQRSRYKQITQALRGMPDLSRAHPETARRIMQDVGLSDMKVGALSFGIMEGITRVEAMKLAEKINDKGIKPKFKLDIPSNADIGRVREYRRAG